MSPSWRDRIEAIVSPHSVQLLHRPRGWRPAAPRAVEVACSGEGAHPAAALAALSEGLAQLSPAPGAAVTVQLSHRFVRLALVAGGRELGDEVEREAAARHGLRKVAGDEVQRWRVVLDGAPGTGAAVAAGLDAAWLDGLAQATSAVKARLAAVQPLLATAARQAHALLGAAPAWLAVAEPGHLVLAAVQGGTWLRLRTHRLRAAPGDELPALLEQAGLLEGLADVRRVVVATHGLPAFAWPGAADWDMQQVRLDIEAGALPAKAAA